MQKIDRAAIYIRVSSPDQVDNFSLEAQEQAAREYAKAKGWNVYRVYADEGFSARTGNRPQFKLMLNDVKLRLFNVILVHKLDRLFRNLSQMLNCVQRLDNRDVSLVSISEDVDFSSASGRMLLTSIGMISEFYSNNLREETVKGKHQRAKNGLWNSCVPFGYQQGRCPTCDDPRYKGACPNPTPDGVCPSQMMFPHPTDSEGVRLAFEQQAKGKSCREVAEFLNAQGYHPVQRADDRSLDRFCKETMRTMLQNETYLGFVKYKGELYPGLHQSLVSRKLFEQCRRVRRDAATLRQTPRRRRYYMLSGLIRCAKCDCVMRGVSETTKRYGVTRYYRDTANERGIACAQKRVKAGPVETEVGKVLSKLRLPAEWQTRIALLTQATPEVEKLERRRRMFRAREKRLKKLFVRGDIGEKQYETQKKRLQKEAATMQVTLTQIDGKVRRLAGDFDAIWQRMTPVERKRTVQTMVKAVYMQSGHVQRVTLNRAFAHLQD